MIMVEQIIGNAKDGQWVNTLNGYEVDQLHLEQWEAPKNRIRKKSKKGSKSPFHCLATNS